MTLEQFSNKPWPAEGRTLGEIIERLVGPELWVYLLDWTGDCLLPSTTNSNRKQEPKSPATCGLHARVVHRQSPPVCYQLGTGAVWHGARFIMGTSDFRIAHDLRFPSSTDHRCSQAVAACLPFLDDWNSGVVVAKARVGGPLEPLTDISPPRTGYTLTIRSLLNSVIVDPTTVTSTVKRYFDVRFFLPEQAAERMSRPLSLENTSPDPFRTGTAGRPTAKDIVLAEADRRIRDRGVVPKQGELTAFSESLETWWEQERRKFTPPGPSMKASAIRNCGVRDLWNSALREHSTA